MRMGDGSGSAGASRTGQATSALPSQFSSSSAAKSVRLHALLDAIDQKIVPILAKAHGFEQASQSEVTPKSAIDLTWFADRLMADDTIVVDRYLDQLRAQGWTIERIYLELLSRTAVLLGERWLLDELSFSDVTIGTARLRQIMNDLTDGFYDEGDYRFVDRGRILLAPVTGEQHSFGIAMVGAFFERAGWRVTRGPNFLVDTAIGGNASVALPVTPDDSSNDWLKAAVSGHDFDVVGLSVGGDDRAAVLADDIAMVRRHSRNKSCIVLVGGPIVNQQPSLAQECGADDYALDAVQALVVAEKLVPRPDNATSHPHT